MSLIKNIAIIGAGNLGIRHFQSIINSTIPIKIEIVDPSDKSLQLAKETLNKNEVNKKIKSINFHPSIDFLENQLDLVIISTSSDVRCQIIKELLDKKKVNNIVLEKVLFQTINAYFEIDKLLSKYNISCWVNHPRRMYPFYQKLKEKLDKSKKIHLDVQGGSWGLGCNSLHFIDLLSFLVNSNDIKLTSNFLDSKILDSKRKGFIEFNGLISGKIDNHSFSLLSLESNLPLTISISSSDYKFIIDEVNGVYSLSEKKDNWKEKKYSEKIVYFQSELSEVFMCDILNNNKCDLPSFNDSMILHIDFIKEIINFLDSIYNTKQNKCNIT